MGHDPNDTNPFNVFSHPSWKPLLDLARERTDCIHRREVPFINAPPDPMAELTDSKVWIDENGSRHTTMSIRAGKRLLTLRTRHDPDVNTVWTVEHLLKDVDDLKAYLELPERERGGKPDIASFLDAERRIGEGGIVMIDTSDPIGGAAPLFDMATYTVIAMTEPELFHRLIERVARRMQPQCEAVARALPGRLWRICGPEYASPPYLPPRLFEEYVIRYDKPMVEAVQKHGGYARIHSHGRLKQILDLIALTGCTGLDPIEPPPQGDVELEYVRRRYGRQMVLFGNIEVSDIENLPTAEFAEKVKRALREGTAGEGRGFVLMPSACPYGRELSLRSRFGTTRGWSSWQRRSGRYRLRFLWWRNRVGIREGGNQGVSGLLQFDSNAPRSGASPKKPLLTPGMKTPLSIMALPDAR